MERLEIATILERNITNIFFKQYLNIKQENIPKLQTFLNRNSCFTFIFLPNNY